MSALGMRRRHQYIPKKPPTGRRPAAGSGAAKASPPKRYRSARTAQTASIGATPRADSIRSTAATCPWRGGRMPESAPAMRLTRSRSPDRERSGAQRRIRTFAPRACRGAVRSLRRRDDGRDGRPNPPPCRATVGRRGHLVSEFDSHSDRPDQCSGFADSRSLDYSRTNGGHVYLCRVYSYNVLDHELILHRLAIQ